MKKIYLIILLTIATITVFGQPKIKNVNLKWGQEFTIKNKGYFREVISGDEKSLNILFGHSGNMISINSLNNNLILTNNKPISLDIKGKRHSFSNIIDVNGNIFIFTQQRNTSDNTNYLYVHKFDYSKNVITSSKELFSYDFSGFRKKDAGGIGVFATEDNSNVWVVYELPSKSITEQKFGFIVFDNQLNEIWRSDFDAAFEDGDFNLQNTLLKSDGNIAIIGKKTNEKNKRKDPLKIDYILYNLNKDGEIIEQKIDLKNHSIVNLTLRQLPNNDIIVTGFYSNKDALKSIKGSFYKLYSSKTNEFTIEETKDFDFKFMTEGLTNREKKRASKNEAKGKETEMPNYIFKDLILKENGGAILIAEQYFVEVVSTYNPNTKSYTHNYHYHYNDIITVSFDKNGDAEWSTRIPKKQVTINNNGFSSSYALVVNKDQLHFVFYDNIDNIISKSSNPVNAFNSRKKLSLCVTTLDSEGNFKKELLLTQKELQFSYTPRWTQQISDNELLLLAFRKKKHKFGILKFEN